MSVASWPYASSKSFVQSQVCGANGVLIGVYQEHVAHWMIVARLQHAARNQHLANLLSTTDQDVFVGNRSEDPSDGTVRRDGDRTLGEHVQLANNVRKEGVCFLGYLP